MEATSYQKTAAVIAYCSDPRIEAQWGRLSGQIKEAASVEMLIPLSRPGVVGIFADGSDRNKLRRSVLLMDVGVHLEAHHPVMVILASHHGCLGHPGDDDVQHAAARLAANEFSKDIQLEYNATVPVRAGDFELRPNPGWFFRFLD